MSSAVAEGHDSMTNSKMTETVEEALWLREAGESWAQIVPRLGVTPRTMDRYLRNAGISDGTVFAECGIKTHPRTNTCADCDQPINRSSTRCTECAINHRYWSKDKPRPQCGSFAGRNHHRAAGEWCDQCEKFYRDYQAAYRAKTRTKAA